MSTRSSATNSKAARFFASWLCCVVALLLMPRVVEAQEPTTDFLPMEGQPVPGLERIRVDEHLLERIPLDTQFVDHNGQVVRLGDYFDGERPVLLMFAYHSCPTLCSMVLSATVNGVQPTQWTAGDEFRILTISIDPRDTPEIAAEKRLETLRQYGRLDANEEGWEFLTGSEEAIQRVSDAAGYHFFFDGRQQQYGHPAAIMLMTPDGRLARYLYGLRFDPSDIRLGLLEASEGRSITTTESFLLYCYSYSESDGGYTLVATRIMRFGGVITMLLLGGMLFIFWRKERRKTLAARAARVASQSVNPGPTSTEAAAS
ncbi:MAG: protein SCO1/2 [Polyangiales bacterium]|jgi:protein SCO1/2